MNKVILVGRLVRDPEIKCTGDDSSLVVAHYTLAINRRYKKDREDSADFIRCVAFGKAAQFAEKYLYQGIRICICGRLKTGSYTNRDGRKVYTTDVIVEEQYFTENRKSNELPSMDTKQNSDGFMDVPDGMDEELPFH